MIHIGPPELIPATKPPDMPNQLFVNPNATPNNEKTLKLLLSSGL